jgi:hypothetical protein
VRDPALEGRLDAGELCGDGASAVGGAELACSVDVESFGVRNLGAAAVAGGELGGGCGGGVHGVLPAVRVPVAGPVLVVCSDAGGHAGAIGREGNWLARPGKMFSSGQKELPAKPVPRCAAF